MQYHELIHECVRTRGAFQGRTERQNFARSMMKLQEEVAEVIASFPLTRDVETQCVELAIIQAGEAARQALTYNCWKDALPVDMSALKAELADVYVVLACLVSAVESISGSRFDVAELALAKARSDITRRLP